MGKKVERIKSVHRNDHTIKPGMKGEVIQEKDWEGKMSYLVKWENGRTNWNSVNLVKIISGLPKESGKLAYKAGDWVKFENKYYKIIDIDEDDDETPYELEDQWVREEDLEPAPGYTLPFKVGDWVNYEGDIDRIESIDEDSWDCRYTLERSGYSVPEDDITPSEPFKLKFSVGDKVTSGSYGDDVILTITEVGEWTDDYPYMAEGYDEDDNLINETFAEDDLTLSQSAFYDIF